MVANGAKRTLTAARSQAGLMSTRLSLRAARLVNDSVAEQHRTESDGRERHKQTPPFRGKGTMSCNDANHFGRKQSSKIIFGTIELTKLPWL
jgi:hypothetical protein